MESLDLAGKSVGLPYPDGLLQKALIKPSDGNFASSVGDYGLLEVFAKFGIDVFEVRNLGIDGDLLTFLEGGDGGDEGAVDVAGGIVVEEVFYGVDAQTLEFGGIGVTDHGNFSDGVGKMER